MDHTQIDDLIRSSDAASASPTGGPSPRRYEVVVDMLMNHASAR